VARVSRVLVSTDSETIAETARVAGAEVPFIRPADLARDDSPEWLVWRHALRHLRQTSELPDALLVVPPTAPLRAIGDLDRCLDTFEQRSADIVITVTDAHRNPYFNMVTVGADGMAALVLPSAASRRQDAPAVFDIATVGYVARPAFVLERGGLFEGRVQCVHVPPERALDIDTPLDWQIAECLLRPGTEQP
jgi:N-acylneuraminate cytidylyltransferase